MAASWHRAFNDSQKENILDKMDNISCKKGCHSCCSMPVIISEDEAKLLKLLVENGKVQTNMFKLEFQARHIDTLMELPIADRLCVFLKDGECAIYDNRPLSCRNYLVTSPKEDCDNANIRGGGVDYVSAPIVDIAVMAAWNNGASGPLQVLLLKELMN